MDQKWVKKKQGLLNLFKKLVINFFWIISMMILFAVFLHKSHIWEMFCTLGMGQNALIQADRRIF